MDTDFCDRTFPYRWRSSLAISAFEPSLDDLPEDLCDERLTYLRVTSTITGYQPSKEETETAYAAFPDVPTEELTRILGEYFACYGVQLNVAVFPGPSSDVVEIRERVEISFEADPVGQPLPNPLDRSEGRFEQVDQSDLQVVDLFPPGGDGAGELGLRRELVVSLPATDRVEAVVYHASRPVRMEAFADGVMVDVDESGPEQDQTHQLAVTGQGIDRIVFAAPANEASLLSIAYWRSTSRPATLADYPHIVDFEPKIRDLYQAATETGEVLTASVSSIATDKTLTHTETSETGLSLGAKYTSPDTPYGKAEVSGSLSHKWGETDSDVRQVGADASRERRERQGSTTAISQMYNLLTGYHAGTNRAVFLMLPRPHVLQPTDRRTFVQGLRTIEGVQEYFLVVTRPRLSRGMCVEVALETGHFPEQVVSTNPPVEYDETSAQFITTAYAKGGTGLGGAWNAEKKEIEASSSSTYTVPQGWVIDRRPGKGDPGHPGVAELANASNSQANSSLRNYNYQATSDTSVQVSGTIEGANGWGAGAVFHRTYQVLLRSEQPKDTTDQPHVTTPFLITARGLCVRYRSTDTCPEVVPDRFRLPPGDWVVDESDLEVVTGSARRGTAEARLPAMKEALRQIQQAMAKSARMPSRRPLGAVGFLESDYFTSKIAEHVPADVARQRVTGDDGMDGGLEIGDLLRTDLGSLHRHTGLSTAELAELRARAVRGRSSGDRLGERPQESD